MRNQPWRHANASTEQARIISAPAMGDRPQMVSAVHTALPRVTKDPNRDRRRFRLDSFVEIGRNNARAKVKAPATIVRPTLIEYPQRSEPPMESALEIPDESVKEVPSAVIQPTDRREVAGENRADPVVAPDERATKC